MRVIVIGAGAIGGPIAAHLVENDVDTTVVTKSPKLAEIIRTKGLKLQGTEETRFICIKAVPAIEDLKGHFEIVFLAMKATDVEEATMAVLPFLNEDSVCVTLQNGIVEDKVAGILGSSRVIGAVVGWASTMVKPGIIEKTSNGNFIIGLLDDKGNQQRLSEVGTLLGYCQPVVVSDNIYGALYAKLIINACITGLGAVCGQTFGEMLAFKRTRRIFMEIATESVAIADRMGITLEKIGKLNIQSIVLSETDTEQSLLKKHLILETVGQVIKDGKSSSLQSLQRGRKTEIDFLNGYIVKKGEEQRLKTPFNSLTTQLVKEIEAGSREITPENLQEYSLV